MSDAAILSHFHKKQFWMASHVKNAQFPTPESIQGLNFYKASEKNPSIIEHRANAPVNDSYTFYAVDCHPLMVRYARTLAQKWPESESASLLEFLSQLSLTDIPTPDGINVSLHVAMQSGKPVATGMIFSSLEDGQSVVGLYDIFGMNDEATATMRAYLEGQTDSEVLVSE
ncbi:hypothetical protein [Enterovibrio calviensis]|uniref:hypothetical protein n=1 Tax=Enterovibrio calviensis TaxID=91359 RepID=UPI000489E391|nr:hypothetical protein [Enterovibrio calviensis]